MNATARLSEWVSAQTWCPLEASFRLKVDRSHLGRLMRGERMPGRRLANRIERLSADWAEGPILSMEWDAQEDANQRESA